MSPIGAIVIVVLGIVAPFLTIVCLPLRALYLIVSGRNIVRIAIALLLAPWTYFTVQILKFGYVSVQDRPGMPGSTGPTVDPRYWLLIGAAWVVVEFVHRAHLQRSLGRGADGENNPTTE